MFGSLKNRLKKFINNFEEEGIKDIKPVEPAFPTPKPVPHVEKTLLGKLTEKIIEKELSEEEIDKCMEELKLILFENDVAFEVAEEIANEVKTSLVKKKVKRGKIKEFVKDVLKESMIKIMKQEVDFLEKVKSKKPFLILFLGFNGVGKTTSIAKIAKLLMSNGFSVVIAAADTFRAAAIEQLEEHGKNLGVKVIKHQYGADGAAVVFDSKKYAEANKIDVILVDTAGRSHADVNLMDELKKICRVNNPDMKILVLDVLTGNDIYDQAKLFDEAVSVDGIILAKADVYEKGGVALSAIYTIKKPIFFLGTGQQYEDIQQFDPEKIVTNLLEF